MDIAILGAGNVGGWLGRALTAKGHNVIFGVRDPNSEKSRAAMQNAQGSVGTVTMVSTAEAVNAANIVALTIPWPAAEEGLTSISDWEGKILIDATNRFNPTPSPTVSAASDVVLLTTYARVVKALNTIGAEQYANPDFHGTAASMLIAGDDAEAKSIVSDLLSDLGFDPVDAGPLANAWMLESLAILWVSLARSAAGRNIAFRLLRR